MAPDTYYRFRVVGLSLIGTLLMFAYGITAPAVESLFLEAHSSEELPFVWLLVAALAVLTTALYNRMATGRGLMRLFALASLASGVLLAALLGTRTIPLWGTHYLLYAWKDIHVVLLVEIFYSYTNAVFPIHRARWLYGLFGALSSLGGIAGSACVHRAALIIGTPATLSFTTPVFLLLMLGGLQLGRRADQPATSDTTSAKSGFASALGLVRGSGYLLLLVLIVGLTQVAITLIDFEYNRCMEAVYPATDARTSVFGTITAIISTLTLILHGATGPILRLAGIPITLLAIPLLLLVGLLGYLVFGGVYLMMGVKIASKCLDYTLFRSAKELLYIPLDLDTRTRGKSVVDMITYRFAKGIASLLLLLLVAAHGTQLVSLLTLPVLAAWFIGSLAISRKFRNVVPREVELHGK